MVLHLRILLDISLQCLRAVDDVGHVDILFLPVAPGEDLQLGLQIADDATVD
eukprot:CAMPEP_0170328304 /NCGR_PEP_ID=MMETSP0116_2-20130129/65054_1 /TAXON_ID=400756 /ORGANISM="Durinskia baltica, Strain CSIRO CS-38" /LENGTH=51 /DNA_ID=CAMNT_0010581411 /DNA_START=415 /DNA_END=567 /DNA_ORIENTATION=+